MTHILDAIRLAAMAQALADRAVIADIECAAIAETDAQGRRWHDTRPMLDPREQPDVCIEMTLQALSYAHERGLISPHPQHSHLVRIVNEAA